MVRIYDDEDDDHDYDHHENHENDNWCLPNSIQRFSDTNKNIIIWIAWDRYGHVIDDIYDKMKWWSKCLAYVNFQPREYCILDCVRALSQPGGKSGSWKTEFGQVSIYKCNSPVHLFLTKSSIPHWKIYFTQCHHCSYFHFIRLLGIILYKMQLGCFLLVVWYCQHFVY